MNIVDSCGWLEYFSDGPNADFFAPALEAVDQLLVPTICLMEVFRHTRAFIYDKFPFKLRKQKR